MSTKRVTESECNAPTARAEDAAAAAAVVSDIVPLPLLACRAHTRRRPDTHTHDDIAIRKKKKVADSYRLCGLIEQ